MGCPSYNFGSQEKYIVKIAEELRSQGHKYFVVYENLPENKEFVYRLKHSGAKLFTINPVRYLESRVKNKFVKSLLNPFYDIFDLPSIIKIRKIIKDYHIDIIHSYFSRSLYASFIGKLMGKKTCRTLSNPFISSDSRVSKSIFKEIYLFTRNILPMIFLDKTIALSKIIDKELSSYGIFNDKIIFISTGVNVDFFNPINYNRGELRKELGLSNSDFIIGYTGRIENRQKNLLFAIRVVKKVIKNNRNIFFVLVGGSKDDYWKNRLIEESKSLGINNQIIFLGRRENIASILKDFDVFLMTSFYEGMPGSLMEAMSMELPCVTSNAHAFQEIIKTEQNGFLCDLESPKEFSNCLNRLKKESKLRKTIGLKARRTVIENYNFQNRVDQTIKLYTLL